MDQGQKFKAAGTTLAQDEKPFEFKPLDLTSITGKPQRRTKIVLVACPICGEPGCYLEKEVPVDDEGR